MSYILEALQKAETERRAEAVPAAPLPPGFANGGRESIEKDARRWLWIAAVLAAALSAAAWLALRGSTPPQAEAGIAATTLPAPVPATAAAVPGASDAEHVAPPAVAPAPEPAATATAQEKPLPEKPARKKPERKPQPPSGVTATRVPKESGTEATVATLNDLPAAVRNEIPPLTIGGYIYAGNRADRSVLINKRLLREGDEIAPGFTLEQMTRDGMVLNYKGYRYRASY